MALVVLLIVGGFVVYLVNGYGPALALSGLMCFALVRMKRQIGAFRVSLAEIERKNQS
jgi:hypothetical protein